MMTAEHKQNPGLGQKTGEKTDGTAAATATNNIQHSFLDYKLAESGLTREHATQYGLREDKQGLTIPYFDPITGKAMLDAKGRPFTRTRLIEPYDGTKYKSRKGAGIRCFIPAATHKHLQQDTDATVIITEGELKAIKATEDGLPTIGIGGIWNWVKEGGNHKLHPDLAQYAIQGREFLVIWDSDASGRKEFDRCTLRLAQALADYECKLFRLDLPPVGEGKTGLDDYLVAHDLSDLTAVIDRETVEVPPYMTGTDAQSLMNIEFPPIKWVVSDVVPDGLSLLAGKSKLGKSWLALNIALAVGYGGKALGQLDVDAGEVLYLALEDNLRRLQTRLQTLLDDAESPPATVHFWTELPASDLNKNVHEIETWLEHHNNARLVVIDTLARVKPANRSNSSTYEDDTAFMAELHRVAQNQGVGVLLVHHTRKASSDDPFDQVLGSTGIMGVADTTLLLTRGRGEADGKLQITGRDIGEQEYALKLTEGQWNLLGNAVEYEESKAARAILEVLKEQPMTSKELARELDQSIQSVNKKVRRLRAEGALRTEDDTHHAV